jgi:L-alanine-DL-glutamate epimerase-like enolase superfamily enzyme
VTAPCIDGFVLTIGSSGAAACDVALEASSGSFGGVAVGRIAEPAQVEALCRSLLGRPLLDQSARWRSHGEAPGYGLVECALADLAARRAGLPLGLWLGGTAHESLPLAVVVDDIERAPQDAALLVIRARDWRDAIDAAKTLRGREAAGTQGRRNIAVDLGGGLTSLDSAAFDAAAKTIGIDLAIDPAPDILTARKLATAVALRAVPGHLADVAAALEEDRAQAIVADAGAWGPAGMLRLAALCRVFQASLHVASAAHPIATAFAAHLARATPAATCIVVLDELFAFATRATPGLGGGLALDPAGLAHARRIAVAS